MTDPVPTAPTTDEVTAWKIAFVQALGWGTQGFIVAADSADCLDKHRAAGDIR